MVTKDVLSPPGRKRGSGLPEGAQLCDDLEAHLRRFLVLPSADAFVALVLWAAHTHMLDAFESTPRLLVTSPEPGSGKTRVLELLAGVVPRPIEAVNVTPSYLFRKVEDPEGRPTILFDEVDTVFGPKAKDNEEIRGFLNAGHTRRSRPCLACQRAREGRQQGCGPRVSVFVVPQFVRANKLGFPGKVLP